MTAQSLLRVMARLFLLAGVIGLALGFVRYFGDGPANEFGVMFIGGTFWLLCAAVALFLRTKLR